MAKESSLIILQSPDPSPTSPSRTRSLAAVCNDRLWGYVGFSVGEVALKMSGTYLHTAVTSTVSVPRLVQTFANQGYDMKLPDVNYEGYIH